MKKIVIFGAGKIGRSFIGQLFSRSGYEVVFVDVYKPVIDALNKDNSYKLIIKSDIGDVEWLIENVRAVNANDVDLVIDELSSCDLVCTSVGIAGLVHIIPVLAKGVLKRFQNRPDAPMDIIIAENMRDSDKYFRKSLSEHLPSDFPIDTYVGLVETSIGKMVPIMPDSVSKNDILTVYAEPYNTLILDRNGFKSNIPDVGGLQMQENIKAWVDRKLFIHNLGHACAAYAGYFYHPKLNFIYEVLEDEKIRAFVHGAMEQSANILMNIYPDEFSKKQLLDHIDDLIKRFRNKALGDTVYRVGCDLHRKLNFNDRLLAPWHAGTSRGLAVDKISEAICYALFFKAKNEQGMLFKQDAEFIGKIDEFGEGYVLENVCRIKEPQQKIIMEKLTKLK